MKKYLLTIIVTAFVIGNIVATLCFKACGKRIEISECKIVDDDWDKIIDL